MAHHTCDYLIIGNSAAGVTAAEFLSAAAPDKSIIMVSHEPYRCYGRPLISYLLEGKTGREHFDYKSADFYEKRGIETLFGAEFEAVALDASAHEVKLAGGEEISYGKCLLATGSVPFIPPIVGMEGRTNVHTFITLDDALTAWDDVLAATERAHAEGRESRVVVIGGGLIGMKAAEALSHHADRIDVFDRSPRILPAVLDADGAAVVSRLVEPHGIFCHPSMSVDEMLGEGERVTHVRLTDGSDEACDMVIVAVGVRHAVILNAYADAIRKAMPDRPLFLVTGATTSFAKRRALRKTLRESKNGILLCTQQSLPSSVNFEFVNKIIIPELHYNNAQMSQFYMRFVRYTSTEWKDIYFLTYEDSIEANLLQMVLAKERINLFMKGADADLDEVYKKFGVDYNLQAQLLSREADADGRMRIRWGQQQIA